MKNIGEAVSIVRHLERPPREVEEKAEAEAEYEIHRKTTMFFLEEDPSFKIYSQIEWCKNLKDEIVLIAPDISFYHVRTNLPYRNVLACILGCTGWDDEFPYYIVRFKRNSGRIIPLFAPVSILHSTI